MTKFSRTLIVGFFVFLINIVDCQLSSCKYIQYDYERIELIDQCLMKSINGIVTATIISCDESGRNPIFTQFTYNGGTCKGQPISTNTFNQSNLLNPSSYNCEGNDCALVYRLHQRDQRIKSCAADSQNFDDIGVIRFEDYQISKYCRTYDCKNDKVMVTDCYNGYSLVINYTTGICDSDNMYFDRLLHCGDSDSRYNVVFGLPDPPTKSPTKNPSHIPTSNPSHVPTTYTPTNAPHINMTFPPSTNSMTTTLKFYASDTTSMQTIDNYWTQDRSAIKGGGIIYSLPAIPIEAFCFLVTIFLLIICIYYVFFEKHTKAAIVWYLKPFIISAFLLNVIGISCITAISIILQTRKYNKVTMDIAYIPYCIASVCYIFGRFCLQSVFLLRVYLAFKNNVFRMSKPVLVILFIWMLIVSTLWSIVFLVNENNVQNAEYYNYYNYTYIAVTVLDALLTTNILYLFVKRLQGVIVREGITMKQKTMPSIASNTNTLPTTASEITKAMYRETSQNCCTKIFCMYCCCCVMNDEDKKEIKAIKSDLKSQNSSLVFIITKLCVLGAVALITTSVFGIYLFYELSVAQRYITYALWAVDICINSICLFMNFNWASKMYTKCCYLPHVACQSGMEHVFVAKISATKTNEVNV